MVPHGFETRWYAGVVAEEVVGLANVHRGGVVLAVLGRLAHGAHVELGALAWAIIGQPQQKA